MDELYGWKPDVIDINEASIEATGKRPTTMSDLAELTLGGKFCWRAKIFSAHVAPSFEALRHRDHYVSIIYVFARDYITFSSTDAEQEQVTDEPEIITEEEAMRDRQLDAPSADEHLDTPATEAPPVARRLFEGTVSTPTFHSPSDMPRWSPMAEVPPPTRRRVDFVDDPQFFGERREGPTRAASRHREERYDAGPFRKEHRPHKRY